MWRTITAIAVSLVVPLMIEATGLATPRDHASHILIPAAISADGGNGTKFRSDIRITNLRGTPQLVVIYWLPAGVGGVERFELVELQSGETLESDDFVHEVLNASGLGAIGVGGLNEETDPDPNAMLHVTSRVWTPQPGTAGTSSQALAPIPVSDIESTHVFIKGHRRNEQYRTNVGIVNLDDADHHYLVTVSGEVMTLLPEEYSVTVPGESVIQIPTSGVAQNQLRIDVVQAPVEGETTSSFWVAYASSVDNITGDGWTTVGANLDSRPGKIGGP